MDNLMIAQRLMDYASYLDVVEPNLYRVRAYRRAAESVLALECPAAEVLALQGRKGLQEVPGIGRSLAVTIERLVRTGELGVRNTGRCHGHDPSIR